jgi:hypothetical protein
MMELLSPFKLSLLTIIKDSIDIFNFIDSNEYTIFELILTVGKERYHSPTSLHFS